LKMSNKNDVSWIPGTYKINARGLMSALYRLRDIIMGENGEISKALLIKFINACEKELRRGVDTMPPCIEMEEFDALLGDGK